MKVVNFLSRVVLVIFGLAALLYLIAVAVNWNDQPPSAAAREFDQLLATRPPLTAAENGFVYLLGFEVPVKQDPREVGARRFAWLGTFYSQAKPGNDPLESPLKFKSQGSAAIRELIEKCNEEDRKACADTFEKNAIDWQPTEIEALALQRYRALLGHPAWRDVPFHLDAPLPPYASVIYAQRLHHLSMMQLAAQGKADEVRAGLEADLAYWRGSQRDSELLVGKMVAVAGLRHHFFFSNLILRRLPTDQVLRAVPAGWQREFTADERSMRLVMAGELKFLGGIFRKAQAEGSLTDAVAEAYEPTFSGKWAHYVAKPIFQEQDTMNGVADRYLRFTGQFAVPMREYAEARATIEKHVFDHPQPISLYNPVGDYYMRLVDDTNYLDYAYRSANPEGMRQAALLVAQFRARGVAAKDVKTELGLAELRDPYTLAPFGWDATHASVYFMGVGESGRRYNEYFY